MILLAEATRAPAQFRGKLLLLRPRGQTRGIGLTSCHHYIPERSPVCLHDDKRNTRQVAKIFRGRKTVGCRHLQRPDPTPPMGRAEFRNFMRGARAMCASTFARLLPSPFITRR